MDAMDFDIDDDVEIDLEKLPPDEREAIMSRVTPDDSTPVDAFSLGQNDLRRELIDRGIQPKGFFNDDAARLQEELNAEHSAERESRMTQKIQTAARNYLRETIKRKRQQRETELSEEIEEIANNPKLEVWLDLVKANTTPMEAQFRVNSVATRALSKVLPFNLSLRALNLSGNQLDDMAGKAIANVLRRNTSLQKLEAESNLFGPTTMKELAAALAVNEGLAYLSLESNPLTADETDFSGIAAFGGMLAKNATLTSVNLWRTRLGVEGGKALVKGLYNNSTVLCLDVGNNKIALSDANLISKRVAENIDAADVVQRKRGLMKKGQMDAAERERKRNQDRKKQEEHEQWLDDRAKERSSDREKMEAERQRQAREDDDRMRQAAWRKQAEFQAKLELEKKKKSKGKKKK
ncbi:hypothetical protein SPRG_02160 [Saprolegnia parasitica CBS 223.65]|uniref:Uncharacterized protein n=1 Tax=Saprolegnia parasitica (strain CBS 223.65) TaxID=695850 RepID=A0A067CS74_SAPPC|nr:hypothetical protein SPRG_02160 [Saprolegnia parasitica CBS 223.65]KDO33353.1 hypothetical protein SPRG_02160 [Saprolegnia parasitica CBS 223.65]|eukprot:XP_012196101.1 hypothetical protein SPRG_02160 [Saprolegnia parasitica CBS 223.65]